uniref:RFX-type winged-helix domain-containing protein n=1 Tax=Globodera pallida TaxID=36090 RepID=A0A183BMS8_GLOPA
MMFMCSNMLDEDEMSDNNPPIFVPPPSLGPPSSASAGGAVVVIEELDSRHNSNIGVFHHYNFLPPLISGGDDDLSGNVAGTGPRGGGDSPPSPFSSASTAADLSPSDWCWLEPSPPQPNLGPHQHQLPNNPSLFRQQHHTYAAAAAAATAAGFEQNNNAGGHPGSAYGGQHSYYQLPPFLATVSSSSSSQSSSKSSSSIVLHHQHPSMGHSHQLHHHQQQMVTPAGCWMYSLDSSGSSPPPVTCLEGRKLSPADFGGTNQPITFHILTAPSPATQQDTAVVLQGTAPAYFEPQRRIVQLSMTPPSLPSSATAMMAFDGTGEPCRGPGGKIHKAKCHSSSGFPWHFYLIPSPGVTARLWHALLPPFLDLKYVLRPNCGAATATASLGTARCCPQQRPVAAHNGPNTGIYVVVVGGNQINQIQHYQPVQQQQQSSGGNTPPALGQTVHTTYVLRQQQQQQQQQQLHHPTAAAAVQQHFQRHRQRAEVGAAHLEQKQSLVVVVEAGGSDRDDEHGNNIDGNKLGDDEDGTAGDGTEDDMALLAEDGTQEAGGSGHTTRAAPETLAWLHANYESYPGASLPRCTLYEHYQNHCREIGLSPVNAASFGKLIRNSFKDLLTRRLGTRGNSKYHYSGIRIKPSSALLHEGFQRAQQNGPDASAPDEHQRHHSTPTARGTRRHGTRRATSNQQQAQKNAATATEPNSNSSGGTIDVAMMELDGAGAAPQRQQRGQSADFPLPDALSTPADALTFPRVSLPLDDSLDEALLPLGLTVQHALKFQMDYEAHNREVLECLRNLRLESVENVWARFWAGASESDHAEGAVGEEELLPGGHQMQLSREVLYRLCTVPQLLGFVQHVDLCFYQLLLDQLLPDPLRPSLPAHAHGTAHRHQLLLPQMRPFAKNLCACMAKALGDGAPSALRELKLAGVRLLSNAITRLSSVAHLAVTAREVLHSDEQMAQMHADFDRLDFPVLHEQAEWCCDWSPGWLRSLGAAIRRRALPNRRRLEDWADWLDDLAARALQSLAPLTTTRSQKNAGGATRPRQAVAARVDLLEVLEVLSYNFFEKRQIDQLLLDQSSLVLRDFTLRSAASFGQFHLIRLLFDDYLSIAVERRLAQLNGQPAIALMAPEAIPTFLRPSPFALPMQPQQQHVTVPNTVPLYCSHPPPPTTVSMYAVVPANFPLPLPTTVYSASF